MMHKLDRLTPDVDSAGVFEDSSVLTVALSPGYPMLLQRFPVSGQEGHWLDRASAEFSSLPPLLVGDPRPCPWGVPERPDHVDCRA